MQQALYHTEGLPLWQGRRTAMSVQPDSMQPPSAALPAALPHSSLPHSPLIGVLLFASLVLNVLALILPFVVIDAAGSDPWVYGLFGSVKMLWDADMAVLAVMVFTFSVIFPFAKLGSLTWLWWGGVTTPGRHWLLTWVEKLGKWSLFDVFLVAIMVALTNDQWLISSESLPGLTCFLIAVVLGMLAGEVLSATTASAGAATAPAIIPANDTEAVVSIQRSVVLLALVIAVGVLLGLTVTIPFIQIDDWRLADREFSLLSLVPALWQNGSAILAIALGTFVIAMPVISWLVVAGMVMIWWRKSPLTGAVGFKNLLGRWSMLSVFALSLGVFLAEGHHFLATKADAGVWSLVAGLFLAWLGQIVLGRLWGSR